MQQHNFKPGKIDRCQVCGSKKLIDVIYLGEQPLANTLSTKIRSNSEVQKFPINVVRCEECTLLQLDYIVDQNKVYHPDYPYLPGITKTVDEEQKELSDYLFDELNLKCILLIKSREEWLGRSLKLHYLFQEMDKIGLKQSDDIFAAYKNDILEQGKGSKLQKCGKYCVQDSRLVLLLFNKLQTLIGLLEMAKICKK